MPAISANQRSAYCSEAISVCPDTEPVANSASGIVDMGKLSVLLTKSVLLPKKVIFVTVVEPGSDFF